MSQITELQKLKEENRRLQEENHSLRRELLQFRMEKAISDDEGTAMEMHPFFPEPASTYYLMILFCRGGQRDGSRAETLDAVQRRFSNALKPFGQTFFFEISGRAACLLNFSQAVEAEKKNWNAIETQLSDALTAVLQHTRGEISYICLSKIDTLEVGLRPMYRSAMSVAAHRTTQSPLVCRAEEPEAAVPVDSRQGYLLEMDFWRLINQQNFYEAAVRLDQLIAADSAQNGFLERAQPAVFSRLELVVQTICQKLEMDPMRDGEFPNMMLAISKAETYQELRDAAHDILALLEDTFYTPPNTRNRKMISIERYIRENFSNQNLGAALISERFKISTSYLSRIFREDMGMSVVTFIHEVRIAEAKRLLAETERSILEIAESVGFSNHWVFIRAFKKQEGITPGAYREKFLLQRDTL